MKRVESALERLGRRRVGASMWPCPAHDDRTPSLCVKQGECGALVYCHAGCTVDEVLSALGLDMADLFDEPAREARAPRTARRAVTSYLYTDCMGEPLARKVRYEPKRFEWEVANGSGWRVAKGGEGNPGVLYRLPEVVEADHVHMNEGEKAADALAKAGHCATCPPTSRWTPELVGPLRGKTVTLWVDRDAEGQKKARKAIDALLPVGKTLPVVKTLRVVRPKVEAEKSDAFDHLAAGYSIAEAVELDPVTLEPRKARPTPCEIGFSGERLLDLLQRPKPEPIYAGIPVPGHLWLIVAPALTGKSSLAYWLAMARAAGVPPWDGVPAREAGRVLLYSIDEAPEQVARRMHGLAASHPAGRLGDYAKNLVVIGPDRDTDPEALDGLRFDDQGLATLRAWLEEAEANGEPFAEVYVDAYADVLPLGQSENSNEEATRIGGELERLAVRTGAATTLLHHSGKPRADAGDSLVDVRFVGRGASALAAKARVVTALESVSGLPHFRRLRTITNLGRSPKPVTLQVCSPESDAEELIYFRPHDPFTDYRPEAYLSEEFITTNDLAWALAEKTPKKGKKPPGDACELAAQLRERWHKGGLIEVRAGVRRAKLMRLKAEYA